jgi:hypothetical protein
MAKQKAVKGESAKQVAIDVLRAAAGPLKAKEVAKRVIDSGRCAGLKGKTPEATISAMLAVGSKPGGPFKRVDKGTYALADSSTPPATGGGAQKREPKPQTQRRAAQAEAAAGKADKLNARPNVPTSRAAGADGEKPLQIGGSRRS